MEIREATPDEPQPLPPIEIPPDSDQIDLDVLFPDGPPPSLLDTPSMPMAALAGPTPIDVLSTSTAQPFDHGQLDGSPVQSTDVQQAEPITFVPADGQLPEHQMAPPASDEIPQLSGLAEVEQIQLGDAATETSGGEEADAPGQLRQELAEMFGIGNDGPTDFVAPEAVDRDFAEPDDATEAHPESGIVKEGGGPVDPSAPDDGPDLGLLSSIRRDTEKSLVPDSSEAGTTPSLLDALTSTGSSEPDSTTQPESETHRNSEPPLSLLEQFKQDAGEDVPPQDAIAEETPAPEQEPEKDDSFHLDDAENPDSVASYMEQLLQRSRRETDVTVGKGPAKAGASQPAAATSASPSAPPAEDETSSEEPDALPEPIAPKARPTQNKEELRARLASLREVANASAQSAIANHSWRKMKEAIRGKFALTTAAGGVSAALASAPLWLGMSITPLALVAGAAFGVSGLSMLYTGLKARNARKANKAEHVEDAPEISNRLDSQLPPSSVQDEALVQPDLEFVDIDESLAETDPSVS